MRDNNGNTPRADDRCKMCGHRYGAHMADRSAGTRNYCPKVDASPSHTWPWRDTTFVSNVCRPAGRDPRACPVCSHGDLTSDLCGDCGLGYEFAMSQAVDWLRECERSARGGEAMDAFHAAADMLEDGTAFIGGFREVLA